MNIENLRTCYKEALLEWTQLIVGSNEIRVNLMFILFIT